MNTTTLQVPLPKSLKASATAVAHDYGFSSLQDIVRLFLAKFSRRELVISVGEPAVRLSTKNEKRYLKMDKDFDEGKNVFTANSVDELMKDLTS